MVFLQDKGSKSVADLDLGKGWWPAEHKKLYFDWDDLYYQASLLQHQITFTNTTFRTFCLGIIATAIIFIDAIKIDFDIWIYFSLLKNFACKSKLIDFSQWNGFIDIHTKNFPKWEIDLKTRLVGRLA